MPETHHPYWESLLGPKALITLHLFSGWDDTPLHGLTISEGLIPRIASLWLQGVGPKLSVAQEVQKAES